MPNPMNERPDTSLFTFVTIVLTLLIVGGLTGCDTEEDVDSYVARVDDHYLSQEDLNHLLRGLGPVPDSTEARQQVIEQWVERTLLLNEAQRLNLREDPEVRQQLEEQRRNTLVTALKNRIYRETDREPSEQEIRTYFERHQADIGLREPYVRVRHLTTVSEDSARAARSQLVGARQAAVDSIWRTIAQRYAQNPVRAEDVSDQFFPEGRLFVQLPSVRNHLSSLQEGQTAPVIEENDQYHVLQLVRRIPEGTEPELQWVEDEIRERLRIRARKQMYAREVQRLRNRAKANDLIEIPSSPDSVR